MSRPGRAALGLAALALAGTARAQAPPPPPEGWEVPIPDGAMPLSDEGATQVWKDGRSYRAIVRFYRAALSSVVGAACAEERAGDDGERRLACARTVELEVHADGSRDLLDVRITVEGAEAGTTIRVERAFHTASKVVLPTEMAMPPAKVPYVPRDPFP